MKEQSKSKSKSKSKLKLIVRQSIIPLGFKLVSLEILFSILNMLLVNTFNGSILGTGSFSIFQPILISTVSMAKIILMLMAVFEWAGKKYIIRNDNITIQDGVLSNNKKVIKSTHIETIELKQNLVERILNYGTIKIYSPMLNKLVFLRNITKPKNVISNIREVLNSSKDKKILMRA